jgi:hypothetical protein
MNFGPFCVRGYKPCRLTRSLLKAVIPNRLKTVILSEGHSPQRMTAVEGSAFAPHFARRLPFGFSFTRPSSLCRDGAGGASVASPALQRGECCAD